MRDKRNTTKMVDEETAQSRLCPQKNRGGTHPNKHMIRFAFRSLSLVALIIVFALIGISKSTSGDEAEQFHRQLQEAEEPSCQKETADTWYYLTGLICGVLYMFLGLAIVCDEFFVPALEEMSGPNQMNLSMDIAGATLMAAGGSAPELFTSFFGTFQESELGFGTIVGSAVFNVLFVIAMCSLCSKDTLQLTWWPLFRDSFYYVIGLGVLGVFVAVVTPGEIAWWEALILFCMYLGYVTVMAFNVQLKEMIGGKKTEVKETKEDINLDDENCERSADENLNVNELHHVDFRWPGRFRAGLVNMIVKPYRVMDYTGANLVGKIKGDVNEVFIHVDKDNNNEVSKEELKAVLIELRIELDDDKFTELFKELDISEDGKIDKSEFTKWYMGSQERMLLNVRETFDKLDQDKSSTLGREEVKQLLLTVSPNVSAEHIAHDITNSLSEMYKSGEKDEITFDEFEEWYKESVVFEKQRDVEKENSEGVFALLKPPKEGGFFAIIRYLILFPLVVTLAFTVPDVRRPGCGKYCFLSFFMAIAWIGVYSFLMVDWVTIIGDTFGIPSMIMGLTFLAAGTSVPDLLSSVIVARMGHGDMAVSSSIGSNIFDILVGLPLPWFCFALYSKKPIKIGAEGVGIDIGILIGMIILIIATINFSGWKLTKHAGVMMFVFYFAFLVQAVVRALPFPPC